MRVTIESYIILALISLMAILSTGYLASNIYSEGARNFHASCINQLEASDYSQNVIDALKEDAKQKFGEGKKDCLSVDLIESGTNTIAEVKLTYLYQIQFFELSKKYTITGYAR